MTVLDTTALENLPPFLRTPEVAKLLRKSRKRRRPGPLSGPWAAYIRDGRANFVCPR